MYATYIKPRMRKYKACVIRVVVDKPRWEQAGKVLDKQICTALVVIKIYFGLDKKDNIFNRIFSFFPIFIFKRWTSFQKS